MGKKTVVNKNENIKNTSTIKNKKKKEKKLKDPGMPKRACIAYIFYTQDRRNSLIKEKPDLNNKQIISEMSKEWNSLSEKDKEPYVKKAEADKERYKKEMNMYKAKN